MPYKIILKLHELNWWSSESDETQRIQKNCFEGEVGSYRKKYK